MPHSHSFNRTILRVFRWRFDLRKHHLLHPRRRGLHSRGRLWGERQVGRATTLRVDGGSSDIALEFNQAVSKIAFPRGIRRFQHVKKDHKIRCQHRRKIAIFDALKPVQHLAILPLVVRGHITLSFSFSD